MVPQFNLLSFRKGVYDNYTNLRVMPHFYGGRFWCHIRPNQYSSIATSVSALDFDLDGTGSSPITRKAESENLNVTIRAKTNWSNLVAVTDWGGANSRFLELVSCGGSTIIRSNGTDTVWHQKTPSHDVKHITYM